MKKILYKFLITGLFICASLIGSIYGQQAKINALKIQPSNLIEDLIRYRAANTQISVDELVKTANLMLDKQGFNYAFAFDENTCRLIAQARTKQKDPSAPLNLTANLNSVGGDRTSIVLPDEKSECGSCFVYLPVWEASEKDFVTFINGINVKFHLPANFKLNEIALVDNKNLAIVIRRWKIPFRAMPLSISDDGKILFLELAEKQLSDLALMIFDEGIIQFYSRKKAEPNEKGKLLNDIPIDPANPNLTFISFENNQVKQIIRFTNPCEK